VKKTNFMHNLLLVYFVNFYMFRAYLSFHQEVQPYLYNNWYLLFFLDDFLLTLLDCFILSIFRQPLHVSGVSRPIIRRYNSVYRTIGTYYLFRWPSVVLVGLEQSNQDNRQSSKKNNKYQFYTNDCTSWWWI